MCGRKLTLSLHIGLLRSHTHPASRVKRTRTKVVIVEPVVLVTSELVSTQRSDSGCLHTSVERVGLTVRLLALRVPKSKEAKITARSSSTMRPSDRSCCKEPHPRSSSKRAKSSRSDLLERLCQIRVRKPTLTSREPLERLSSRDPCSRGSVLPETRQTSKVSGVQRRTGGTGNGTAGHRRQRGDRGRHVRSTGVGTGRRFSSRDVGAHSGPIGSIVVVASAIARDLAADVSGCGGSLGGPGSSVIGRLGNARELRPFRGLQAGVEGTVGESLVGLSQRCEVESGGRGGDLGVLHHPVGSACVLSNSLWTRDRKGRSTHLASLPRTGRYETFILVAQVQKVDRVYPDNR